MCYSPDNSMHGWVNVHYIYLFCKTFIIDNMKLFHFPCLSLTHWTQPANKCTWPRAAYEVFVCMYIWKMGAKCEKKSNAIAWWQSFDNYCFVELAFQLPNVLLLLSYTPKLFQQSFSSKYGESSSSRHGKRLCGNDNGQRYRGCNVYIKLHITEVVQCSGLHAHTYAFDFHFFQLVYGQKR